MLSLTFQDTLLDRGQHFSTFTLSTYNTLARIDLREIVIHNRWSLGLFFRRLYLGENSVATTLLMRIRVGGDNLALGFDVDH
jgi:hypothetical protein